MIREEAIKVITDYLNKDTAISPYNSRFINALNMAIDVLSADAVQEWVPCSERLPEDGVAVLITTENKEVYIDQVITDPYKERYFQSNTGYDNFRVIAWMSLPEPYREDGV